MYLKLFKLLFKHEKYNKNDKSNKTRVIRC